MELYLQFGYGMMAHCRHLIESWGTGTVILSPRDLDDEQLKRFGNEIAALPGGRCLLDPQFYLPHADHEKLCKHDFWPQGYNTSTFLTDGGLTKLLNDLKRLNSEVRSAEVILPGLFAEKINDDWLNTQKHIVEKSSEVEFGQPLISTIALSSESVRDEKQVSALLEWAERNPLKAYYVVCEHPNGQYLVEDPNWVANVLDLCAGLRLLGSRVILGYCTHQMLVACVAKVSAICSGTWMNVRSFPPEKFKADYEDEIRTRALWYYAPQALSEYKLQYLDIAKRLGVLNLLAPSPDVDGGYVTNLFSGAQPSSIGFNEPPAFRHYLHSLRKQVENLAQDGFDNAVSCYEGVLNEAEDRLKKLHRAGIKGQNRDFNDIIDAHRAAIELFSFLRAPMLRRTWGSL